MGLVEQMTKAILRNLLADFQKRGLTASDLKREGGYTGFQLNALRQSLCGADPTKTVDFDVALEGLEKDGFVGTGPWVAHDNPAGSDVLILGTYSKREYVCLTEKGYKAAR